MAECLVYQTIRRPGVSRQFIRQSVLAILSYLKKEEASVSIHLIGEQRMRQLNRLYRGLDRPTDVLSFAAKEGSRMPHGEHDLGEIFLCPRVVQKQAKRFGVSFQEEFGRMLIHGLLHTLGFDHDTATHAKKMFSLQEDFLESYRVP